MVLVAVLARASRCGLAVPDPLGPAAPIRRGEPRGDPVAGRARSRRYRYQGVLLSGALAGLAGAFLAIEVSEHWREGQTLGLGFIALAALILSNWNPVRLLAAAFLFGFAQAIPLRLDDCA